MLKVFFYLCFIVLLFGCSDEIEQPAQLNNKKEQQFSDFRLDLLLFKDNRKLEVWKCPTDQACFLDISYPLQASFDWPVGVFKWLKNEDGNLVLDMSGSIYHQKDRFKNFEQVAYRSIIDPAFAKADLKALQGQLQQSKSNGQILIVPGNYQDTQQLSPQMNSPHWMAEVYTKLELSLNAYQR